MQTSTVSAQRASGEKGFLLDCSGFVADSIKESRILTHSHPRNDRQRRHRWAAAAIGGASLLGMVAAFAIAPPAKDPGVELTTVIQKLPAPSITLLDTGKPVFLREERVRRSDTIASLMSRLGIYDGEALQFIRSNQQARDMARHLQAGTTVSAETGAWGNLHSLYCGATRQGRNAGHRTQRRRLRRS
jgi:hypothetical protein